ncbi:MAG: hypothetical protein RLZZ502_140 [Pseudomonadota bacterium]
MNITIIGTGYVGLVSGACFARVGHDVLCLDVDERKINTLKQGISPIVEPGLDEILQEYHSGKARLGRLRFTTDVVEATRHGDWQFIAVGTPPDEDGSADVRYVLAAARNIARHMDSRKWVVDKSTVPVGTAKLVAQAIQEELAKRGVDHAFAVLSNPEFLKEGEAINDFMHPDRVVIGADNAEAAEQMCDLYAPLVSDPSRCVVMDVASAELTKYAANAMLAARISLINEIANLASKVGADIEQVRRGIGFDPRIGHHFLAAGVGYGGSCFPKDVQALMRSGHTAGEEMHMMHAIESVNTRQKSKLFEALNQYFAHDLKGKKIAVWGLAFKPNTDDMREAPSKVLIEALFKAGACVTAYDPVAMDIAPTQLPQQVEYAENALHATQGADALAIVTEWPVFKHQDLSALKQHLKRAVVFDGRNLFSPKKMQALGFHYWSVGR